MLFDALDPGLRPLRNHVRETGRVDFVLSAPARTATIPAEGVFQDDWKCIEGREHAGREAWSQHIAAFIPELPTCLSARMPRLDSIVDHRIVVMLPLAELQAMRRC